MSLLPITIRTGLIALLALLSSSAYADIALPFEVPESTLEYQRPLTQHGYVLPLSAPKRISNEVSFEKFERMDDGSGREYLLRLDSLVSNEAAHTFFVRALGSAGEVLFACEQRACESGSDWANDFFKEPKLYGRDNEQYYVSASFVKDGKRYSVGVYSVLNGRRHAYSYIRVFESANPEQVKVLPGQAFTMQDFDGRDLTAIRTELEADVNASLWLVAYASLQSGSDIPAQLSQQTDALKRLKELLVSQHGIASERIQTHVAGPFHEPDRTLTTAQWFKLFVLR